MQNTLSQLIADAHRQVGFLDHVAVGMTEAHARTAKPAVAMTQIKLAEGAPSLKEDGERSYHKAESQAAGKELPVSARIIESSQVAQAGARIIVDAGASDALPLGKSGNVGFVSRPRRFTTIKPAQFTALPYDEEVSVSALPIHRANIAFAEDGSDVYAFRCKLPRAMQSEFGSALADEALQSILSGIAFAADHCLLTAIVGSTPASFSIGAAAAAGLQWQELKALVGTSGNGAAVSEAGALRVAGVPAALTNQAAATVVGAFNRSAVSILDNVRMLAERTNVQGDLILTCFVDLVPAIPDDSVFWTVGA